MVFRQEKEDGPLCKFYEVIMDLGEHNQFLNELTVAKDITLFAPSNEAWGEISVQNVIRCGKEAIIVGVPTIVNR